MNVVQKIHQMSRDFYQEICKPIPKKERDELILKIQEFFNNREALLKEMKGPYSPEEQQVGKEIIQYNQLIQDKLDLIKREIQQDILTTKNQKKNTPKYMSAYTIVNDGIYLDKKN